MQIGIGISPMLGSSGGCGVFTQQLDDTDDDGHDVDGTWSNVGITGFNYDMLGFNPYVGATTEIVAAFSFSTGGAIPQGATIDSAILTVYITLEMGSPNFDLGCQDIDAAAQPGAGNLPTGWAITSEAETVNTTPGTGLATVDITSAVQEVVDRTLWDEGRINVMSKNNAGTVGNNNWCVADVGHASPAVQLVITWSP